MVLVYTFLNHTFVKYVMISYIIYVCDLKFNWF